MYSSWPHVVYGFHGCDGETARSVIAGEAELVPSDNDYDWLGNGIYFWENNPKRAELWATEEGKKDPAVIGAVIDLGFCLDLLQTRFLDILPIAHESLKTKLEKVCEPLPVNSRFDDGGTSLVRKLDCAVIMELRDMLIERDKSIDSVRGVFMEGEKCYPGAGIQMKNHIQFCITNPDCIKGYFKPRNLSPQ